MLGLQTKAPFNLPKIYIRGRLLYHIIGNKQHSLKQWFSKGGPGSVAVVLAENLLKILTESEAEMLGGGEEGRVQQFLLQKTFQLRV